MTFTFVVLCALIFASKGLAHELYIQVKEDTVTEELQIDILWGHIRDFLDQADHENYELYVRYPNGEVSTLPLEPIGVQARAYLKPSEHGEYLFWAVRKPSTYSPNDDDTILSKQMAKAVHQVGEGDSTVAAPTDLLLEIVPERSLRQFTTGTFYGTVYFEGSPSASINVSAYGPNGEVLEEITDENGVFALEFNSTGAWLIKANISSEETGSIDGTDYNRISQTSTLVINTKEAEGESADPGTDYVSLTFLFIIGLLLGSAVTLLFTKKKRT